MVLPTAISLAGWARCNTPDLVMDNGAQIQFRGDIQLSNDGLLALEQFALGGANSIRGYRENELVRDQGFALSIEFRYPLLDSTTFPGSLTAIPFMDFGGSWDVSKSNDIEYLHSVGLGLVWTAGTPGYRRIVLCPRFEYSAAQAGV